MHNTPNPSLERSGPGRAGSRRSGENRLLLILVLIGFVLTCLFGLRIMHSFRQIRQVHISPGEGPQVEMIRGWMTIEYLSRVYQVPPEYLFSQLGVPAIPGNERKSLSDLNRQYFLGQPGYLVDAARSAIVQFRETHGPPPLPPVPPLTPVQPQTPLPPQTPVPPLP